MLEKDLEDSEDLLDFENLVKTNSKKENKNKMNFDSLKDIEQQTEKALKELKKEQSTNKVNIKNMKPDELNLELYIDFKSEYEEYKNNILKSLLLISSNNKDYESLKVIRRVLHALKGGFNTLGLSKLGKEIHNLETLLLNYEKSNKQNELCQSLNSRMNNVFLYFEEVEYNNNLQFDEITNNNSLNNKEDDKNVINDKNQVLKNLEDTNIRVSLDEINNVINNQDTFKMYATNLISETKMIKDLVAELEENLLSLDKHIKELEHYAETNIQSNIENKNKTSFDPLLLDRFTKLQEMSRSFSENFLDLEDIKKNLLNRIKDQVSTTEKLNNLTNDSSEKLLKLRLVEFNEISKRFTETQKRVSKELNKDVEFIIKGGNALIDITLSNKIRTPIEHIIRNSIGHGIEDVSLRRKLNKPDKGTIILDVKQKANFLQIKISDDGYGLNIEKIRQKAIQNGMIQHNEKFTVDDAIHFILMPNFSTADKVTDISGRGVGMEAVQADILRLGGSFVIESVETKGMTIKINIPTTYTTTYGLICKVGKEEIIIPNNLVKEVLFFENEQFNELWENKIIDYQNKPVLFRDMKNILKIKSENDNKKQFHRIIILEDKEDLFGVYVDDIIENKEILIKNVSSNLSGIPGVVGVATLVNGKPLFVINPFICKKYEMDRRKVRVLTPDIFGEQKLISDNEFFVPLIMVVDDSALIRKTTAKFLDTHGFKHIEAKHGKEALEKLTNNKVNLILLDIEMPEMNGFDFAEIIKHNDKYKNIPIIMITSRINDIHKKKAKEIGVQEYLIKPFVHSELLKHIKHYAYIKYK